MDTAGYTLYLLVLVVLFVLVLIWSFGRKRKKRFEDDAKIPFDE